MLILTSKRGAYHPSTFKGKEVLNNLEHVVQKEETFEKCLLLEASPVAIALARVEATGIPGKALPLCWGTPSAQDWERIKSLLMAVTNCLSDTFRITWAGGVELYLFFEPDGGICVMA